MGFASQRLIMSLNYLLVCVTLLVAAKATKEHAFLDLLLSSGDHEAHLNEELAQLLEIDFERQGACGSDVTSECCASCDNYGYCYNGGYCCELSKVRSRMLRSGESECPAEWASECKLTRLLPIESCQQQSNRHRHLNHDDRGTSDDDDSSNGSDEDRQLDKAGVRLMCLCVSSKKCCSNPGTAIAFTSVGR